VKLLLATAALFLVAVSPAAADSIVDAKQGNLFLTTADGSAGCAAQWWFGLRDPVDEWGVSAYHWYDDPALSGEQRRARAPAPRRPSAHAQRGRQARERELPGQGLIISNSSVTVA
jgi:hypothetical protein